MNEHAFCKEKYKFLSEGIVSFKNSCTFATHLRKTGAANILVPWMSGLVSGLQNRARRFESARNLQNKKRAYSGSLDEWLSQRSAKPCTAVRIRQEPPNNKMHS